MKKILVTALLVLSLTGCTSAGFDARPVDGNKHTDENLVEGGGSECFYVEEWTSKWQKNTRGLGVFCKESNVSE